MVLLATARSSNASLRKALPSLTAVFVGGTSGIGEATLKQLAKHAPDAHIYIVGRNEARARTVIDSARQTSAAESGGVFEFVKADASLIANVDDACKAIKAKEDRIDLLFLSCGYVTFGGRKETKEGLDELLALRYYSRMRFVQNLTPSMSDSPLARVVSILGAGTEGPLIPDDLELKHNYSFYRSAASSATLNTLAAEHLATLYPQISFVHAFPGIVQTNIFNAGFSAPVSALLRLASPIIGLVATPVEESGERQLFHATSARYPPAAASKGVPLPSGTPVAEGCDGATGSGGYAISPDGEVTRKTEKLMSGYRKDGWAAKVWEHTLGVFDRVAPPS